MILNSSTRFSDSYILEKNEKNSFIATLCVSQCIKYRKGVGVSSSAIRAEIFCTVVKSLTVTFAQQLVNGSLYSRISALGTLGFRYTLFGRNGRNRILGFKSNVVDLDQRPNWDLRRKSSRKFSYVYVD